MEMMAPPPPGGLILTSLRLPFVIKRRSRLGGEEEGGEGEVVREESQDEWARSVAHLVRETGGQWVGWAGSALSETDLAQVEAQFSPVSLGQEEVEAQYRHCREALWPLLHSMADRAVFTESQWAQYSRVNTVFAEATLAALRTMRGGQGGQVATIWVHDYHLMQVPNIVNTLAAQEGLDCRIGYFQHCPFP